MRHTATISPDQQIKHIKEIGDSLKKAIKLAPKEAYPHFALCYYLNFFHQPGIDGYEAAKQARQEALKGLRLNPTSADGYIALGYTTPDDKKQLPLYRKAVQLDGKNADARWLYALKLNSLGYKDEAKKQWKVYEQLSPAANLKTKYVRDMKSLIFSSR
jgi:hypothetical protein